MKTAIPFVDERITLRHSFYKTDAMRRMAASLFINDSSDFAICIL